VRDRLALMVLGRGLAAACLATACVAAALTASVNTARAQPVVFRLGYGGAAEEPIWLLVAKPNLAKNYGKAYTLDATKFTSSDKRAQAFEAGAIDLSAGSANGVIFAAAEGVKATFIASISRESSRGFSTGYYVKESSPIRSVTDLKGKDRRHQRLLHVGHLWLKAALDKHGLAETDVKITPVPFSAMQESLDAGRSTSDSFRSPSPPGGEADEGAQDLRRQIWDTVRGGADVLVGKEAFLKSHAAAIRAMLQDLTASMQFYLERPREARQLLIDARMVRVLPDVYMTCRTTIAIPRCGSTSRRSSGCRHSRSRPDSSARVPTSGRWSISAICRNEWGKAHASATAPDRASNHASHHGCDEMSQMAIAHRMGAGHV
jgi:NitT/TauT family transport system substrate-binding protein/sulfonate transport system substrate-binding protein